MGAITSLCCKKEPDFPPESRGALRPGGRVRAVKNETEDPHAPLLTRRIDDQKAKFDKELDEFVQGLSSDDAGIIPEAEEIEAMLQDNVCKWANKMKTVLNGQLLRMADANVRGAIIKLLCDVHAGRVTVSYATKQIRDVHYPQLLRTNSVDILNAHLGGAARTLRGGIWSLFLGMKKYNSLDAEDAIRALTPEVKRQIDGEIQRFFNARRESEVGVKREEYRFWLVLFSAWLRAKTQKPFDQNLYVFGVLFLRNLYPAGAFQAFETFVGNLGHGYILNTARVTKLIGKIVSLVSAYDSDLGAFIKRTPSMNPVLISFPHVAAFFTQMKPVEGVEKLWDFLVIYGPHFMVYIEAAWLVMHEEQVRGAVNPTDQDNQKFFRLDKPVELLLLAAEVYQKTSDDLRNEISALMYESA